MNTQLLPPPDRSLEVPPPDGSARNRADKSEDACEDRKEDGKTDKKNDGKTGRKNDAKKDGKTGNKPGTKAKSPAVVPVRSWFVTFMCMNIPIIGWIYLLILAFSKDAGAKKDFARAYLIYKVVFLLITLAILAVFVHYGLILLDQLLAYMEML